MKAEENINLLYTYSLSPKIQTKNIYLNQFMILDTSYIIQWVK